MPKIQRNSLPGPPRGYTLDLVEVTGDLTLERRHCDCFLQFSGGATVTLPGDLPDGFHVTVEQSGADPVVFVAGDNATLVTTEDRTNGQYSLVGLYVRDKSNPISAEWNLTGDAA